MSINLPIIDRDMTKVEYMKYISGLLEDIKSEISDKMTLNDNLVDMQTSFVVSRLAMVQEAIQESIRELKRYEVEKQQNKAYQERLDG